MKTLLYKLFILITCSILSFSLLATEHNIFVDGSYNPGNDSDMDRLIDTRLRNASNQIGRINPGTNRQTVDTKQALLNALSNIECKCGDEINLFFMGHGGNERFIFSKQRGRERVLTADSLRAALGRAAIECCCKINIVMFSCHSGSFIEPLMEEEHVRSVYTSSMDDQLSYTNAFYDNNRTFQDGGDWLKGFNEDLEEVRRGSSTAEALAEASKSAKEKMPINFWENETPDAWVRDTLQVLGHVEGRVRRSRGRPYVEVIIYEPEHLRGKKKRIYFGENEFPENLRECMWIQGPADFDGVEDPITFTDDVTIGDKPQETILGHVTRRWRNAVEVHTLRPHWAFCDRKKIRPSKGYGIDRNVQPCKWIEQRVTIHDPYEVDSTDSDITLASPTFRIQYHVEGVNPRTGLITGRVLSPRWLRYTRIIIDPRERAGLSTLRRCTNIWIDITIPPEGDATGANLRRVHQDDVRTWSVDVAINPIETPGYLTMSKVVIPEIVSTNIGDLETDYTVKILIDEVPMVDFTVEDMDRIVDSYNSVPGLSKGNEIEGCDFSKTEPIYMDDQELKGVPPSQSRKSDFKPFKAEPGKLYRLCASIVSENDEVSGNNQTSILFYVTEKDPVTIPESLAFTARGTGRTTGHIIDLTVTNKGEQTEVVTIGYFIVPSTDDNQGYIIPYPYTVSLGPGETIIQPLDGYCIKVNLPPVAAGEITIPIEDWITPDKIGPIVTPDNPPGKESGYVPVDISEFEDFVPVYPGTDVPFPYKIDIDKHLEEVAPTIYYATEVAEEVIAENIGQGSFGPSISSNPVKLAEDMMQQEIWLTTGTIELDTTDNYDLEDLGKNLITQIEKTAGRDYETFDSTTKEAVNTVIIDIYDGLDLVGEKAKILKPNTTRPRNDTGYDPTSQELLKSKDLVMIKKGTRENITIERSRLVLARADNLETGVNLAIHLDDRIVPDKDGALSNTSQDFWYIVLSPAPDNTFK